jgi:hypothetical protein
MEATARIWFTPHPHFVDRKSLLYSAIASQRARRDP